MTADEGAGGDVLAHLHSELARYPEDRYPVQHATIRFHLGAVELAEGRAAAAAVALGTAVRLFEPLPVEQAKALNLLGAAQRALGQAAAAEEAFSRSVDAFRGAQQPLEEAAATHNLGLVALDRGDHASAAASFRRARDLFAAGGAVAQAAVAGRELGSALLLCGEPQEAIEVLRGARADADRVGDHAGIGAAANVAGLAHLALDRPADAVADFRASAGAHPRHVRPDGYAMAKANLALGHERLGDVPRARLAARQARDTPGAPEAAQDQARAVLARLHDDAPGDDLLAVLADEAEDDRPAIAREELHRWADLSAGDRREAAADLVGAHLRRGAGAAPLAPAWLGALLELPPEAMGALIGPLADAAAGQADADHDQFRRDVARGMASFGVPQLLRLRSTFEQASEAAGRPVAWT
jgi:tetratricopeptide (TPR) repeat protein